jgi:hypothetical protein
VILPGGAVIQISPKNSEGAAGRKAVGKEVLSFKWEKGSRKKGSRFKV